MSTSMPSGRSNGAVRVPATRLEAERRDVVEPRRRPQSRDGRDVDDLGVDPQRLLRGHGGGERLHVVGAHGHEVTDSVESDVGAEDLGRVVEDRQPPLGHRRELRHPVVTSHDTGRAAGASGGDRVALDHDDRAGAPGGERVGDGATRHSASDDGDVRAHGSSRAAR